MNGDGWVCDECGKTEVVFNVDRFAMNGRTVPPPGWYVLTKAPERPELACDRWDFCSVECIHKQSKPVGPMRFEPKDVASGATGVERVEGSARP